MSITIVVFCFCFFLWYRKKAKKEKKKKEVETPVTDQDIRKNLADLSLKLMIESELNKMIAERILYELGKETYKDPKLFEEERSETRHDKKKTRFETSRIKKVNTKNERKTHE